MTQTEQERRSFNKTITVANFWEWNCPLKWWWHGSHSFLVRHF